MSWVAVAIGGGAILGYMGSQQAAHTQADAANNATATQKGMFDTTYAAGAPYREGGASAQAKLNTLLGLPSGDKSSSDYGGLNQQFTADMMPQYSPAYQFQLQQGNQALQNSQAAKDGILSGAALKDLIGYNQNFAQTGFGNAFNLWNTQQNQKYARLAGLTSTGENAAVNAGNTGAQTGFGMANTITGAGNAAASGIIGGTNAVTGAINNGLGYYQLNSLLHPGSSVSAADMATANASSDPIGSLNSLQGWTTAGT